MDSTDTGPHVLIVDDDPDTLELTLMLVHRADPTVQVVVARGGFQAMTYLCEASLAAHGTVPMPELILLDINMPDVGGFEVLNWVRQNQALDGINVVMLSTSDSPADITRATQLGADGYLVKFPQPIELACVLREARHGRTSARVRRAEAEKNARPERGVRAPFQPRLC